MSEGSQDMADDAGAPEDEIGKELDLSKDGKLVKIISTAGTGWEKPSQGAEVTVHYTGTLEDGSVFDSSRERDSPFVFKLGEGAVIKGWDAGVKTMKKGERATLRCSPEYAYGESGSPPKIPPNATLNFDVELLSWTEWKDVSANYKKDQTVMKKELVKGEGYDTPDFDTQVTVSWKLTVEGSETVIEEKQAVTETIGSEALPAGLETAIESMKKGETARFQIHPSVRGTPEVHKIPDSVPADAVLVYEVTLSNMEQAPKSWKLKDTAEKFEWAQKRRAEGNELFKSGKVEVAKKKYKASLDFISSDYQMTDAEKEQAKGVKVLIHLNLAACALRRAEWKAVLEESNKVLELHKAHPKALLRRSRAYNELNQWAEAKADLQQVLDTPNAPEAEDAKKELAKVMKKIKAQDMKDKKLYGGMFSKIDLRKPEEPAPAAPKPADGMDEDDEEEDLGEAEAKLESNGTPAADEPVAAMNGEA